MNKLPLAKRVLILSMLVEGSSMRTISRIADVSINTVTKLLVDAGETCLALHDELVRTSRRPASSATKSGPSPTPSKKTSRRRSAKTSLTATCGRGRPSTQIAR
jgi:hypothetical protein